MNECTHIGLDVHKDTIGVAVLRPGTTEVDERVIPDTPEAIRRLLSHHDPTSTALAYEADPTGYDTHRLVTSLGSTCDVIAPSMIPRRSGSHVKTDRIDARNLARLHRAGELTCVRVPTNAEKAVRDLIRVREEVKCDRRIARQRIRSFLVRYGKRYPGPRDAWSQRFEVWALHTLRRCECVHGLPRHGYTRKVSPVSASRDPSDAPMPGVHRVASLLKRWILGTHHGAIDAVHLQSYLEEFTFRFNRRNSGDRGLVFRRLLEQAVVTAPVSEAEVTHGYEW